MKKKTNMCAKLAVTVSFLIKPKFVEEKLRK